MEPFFQAQMFVDLYGMAPWLVPPRNNQVKLKEVLVYAGSGTKQILQTESL